MSDTIPKPQSAARTSLNQGEPVVFLPQVDGCLALMLENCASLGSVSLERRLHAQDLGTDPALNPTPNAIEP